MNIPEHVELCETCGLAPVHDMTIPKWVFEQVGQCFADCDCSPSTSRTPEQIATQLENLGKDKVCTDGKHRCFATDQPCGCSCDNCHDDTEFRCKVCNTIVASIRNSTFYLASTDAPTETVPDYCEDCTNDPRDEQIGHDYHRELHEYLVQKGEREE